MSRHSSELLCKPNGKPLWFIKGDGNTISGITRVFEGGQWDVAADL